MKFMMITPSYSVSNLPLIAESYNYAQYALELSSFSLSFEMDCFSSITTKILKAAENSVVAVFEQKIQKNIKVNEKNQKNFLVNAHFDNKVVLRREGLDILLSDIILRLYFNVESADEFVFELFKTFTDMGLDVLIGPNSSPFEYCVANADVSLGTALQRARDRAMLNFLEEVAIVLNENLGVLVRDTFDRWDWFDSEVPTLQVGSFDNLYDGDAYLAFLSEDTLYPDLLVPSPPLVGIETNPGPDKVSARASNTKRALCLIEVLKARRIVRDRDQTIANSRDAKRLMNFSPEGLFDIKVDGETRDFFTNLVSTIGDDLKNLKIIHTLDLSPPEFVTSILTWISKLGTQFKKLIVALSKVIISFLPKKIFDLVQAIASFFCPELLFEEKFYDPVYTPEMGVFPIEPLVAMLYKDGLANSIHEMSWLKFANTIVEIKKSSTTSATAVGLLTSVLREVVIFLNDTFNLNIPSFGEPSEIDGVLNRMRELQKQFRDGVISEYTFADSVFMVQDEMETMLYSKRRVLDPIVKERLGYFLRKFQPIVTYCEKNINPNNGPRIEPLAMLIAGPSGVGKSTITVPFLLALMNSILPKDKQEEFRKNHNDFMFFRANENEFWDGYKMRNVAVVYDDFGQQKDTAGNPNPDAFELIRLKNTAPYHLHFASIEDKQRNYACPKLIFATSNRSKLHFESITCNEAVIRRFDLAFVQVPRLEYCIPNVDSTPFSRKLDMVKVRSEFPYVPGVPSTFAELSVIEFIEWDFYRGEALLGGRTLSFDQLLKLAIESYHLISNKGDSMLAFHEYMKSYVPEMGDGFHDAPSSPLPSDVDDNISLFDTMGDKISGIIDEILVHKCSKYLPAIGAPLSVKGMVDWASSTPMKTICSITTAVASAYGILRAVSSVVAWFNEPSKVSIAESFSNSSRKEGSKKGSKIRSKRTVSRGAKRSLKVGKFDVEASIPNLDAYLAVVKRNVYLVSVRGAVLGSCLFFGERHFMWPRHFSDRILDLDSLQEDCPDDGWEEVISFLDPVTGRVAFALDFNEDIEYCNAPGNKDISYCYVPSDTRIRSHKDITSMFVPNPSSLKLDCAYDAQLMVRRNDMYVGFNTKLTLGEDVTYCYKDNEYTSRGLTYSAPTSIGDCGAMVMVNDTRLPGPKIMGFHTAGSNASTFKAKNCAGVMIFGDELVDFIKDVSPNHVYEPFSEQPIVEMVPESRVVDGFKTLCVRQAPRTASETKIIPSQMANLLWPTLTKPAHLKRFIKDGECIDPFKMARKNYAHDEVHISSMELEDAISFVTNLVIPRRVTPPHSARLFTFEEAVQGIPGLDYVDSINRSTSAGYPYVLEVGASKGKSKWFGSGEKFVFESDASLKMRANVDKIIESARLNVRLNHIFVDVLKDERRPVAKVDIGKTRQIMTCPIDLLIAMKMYFGDFIRHVMENRIHNGIGVGIDFHTEWDNLAQYMMPSPEHVFTAGDYSAYDGKIPVPIGLGVLKVIEAFYACEPSSDDVRIRRILFQEIINSKHLAEGSVYEFTGGNPSGQPLTSIFNSVANLLILCYNASMICTKKSHDTKIRIFAEDVYRRTRFATFGDDNIISYHPEDSDFWSQAVLESTIPLNVGMSYTNENKDGRVVTARKITEIQFLKRNFRMDRGVYVGPLELSVIKETLSWERKDATFDQMKQRIDATLSELSLHGERVFDEHAPKIVTASLRAYQYSPKNSTYRSARNSGDSLVI